MIRYILKRLLLMIPTILLTSLLIFWAMDLTGGDPVQTILPENATVEQQEALRESMPITGLSAIDVLARIAAALIAGLAVGIEREMSKHPAGLRTNMFERLENVNCPVMESVNA